MLNRLCSLTFVVVVCFTSIVRAEDAFFVVPLAELKAVAAGPVPADVQDRGSRWMLSRSAARVAGYVALDGEGESYLTEPGNQWDATNGADMMGGSMVVRAPGGKDVTGRIFIPRLSTTGMTALKFTLAAKAADAKAQNQFFMVKESHFRSLSDDGIAGTAWFRHLADEAALRIDDKAAEAAEAEGWNGRVRGRRNREDLEELFDVFSGGRAVSENLQLDRALVARPTTQAAKEEMVDVGTLTGITVEAMDWKVKLGGAKPRLDPLAALIPEDQHAVFFQTFAAAIAVADESDAQGTPVQHLLTPRPEDARTVQKYERQLCLSMTGLGRLLGPQMISSVALTGTDPYYLSGTDIAVLFEAANPGTLKTLLTAQVSLLSQSNKDAKQVKGQIAGVEYVGVRSADRTVSSYIAVIGSAVVVTNSPAQLERLGTVASGKAPALSALPEYQFFRSRYSLDDKDESALLVLSDATIRRWCGAKWRIASARRSMALAAMTEVQALRVDDLLHKRADAAIKNPTSFELGTLTATSNDITSSIYGSTGFMTPISELELKQVTRTEADMYEGWRASYQRNWSQYFDPIALRVIAKGTKLAADLTVAPLIVSSEYRPLIELTAGVKISPTGGDPHPNLLHWIIAINKKSHGVRDAGNFLSGAAPGLKVDPLGWMGQSVALYVDEDPLWQGLMKVPANQRDKFLEANLYQLPIALNFEVSDALKLAGFLVAVRGFAEQSSPGLTSWEPIKYKEVAYVKVSQVEGGAPAGAMQPALYYAATPRALIVTFSEELLKRALDRQAERAAAKPAATQAATTQVATTKPAADGPAEKAWLGEHLSARISRSGIELLQFLMREGYQSSMQEAAWSNLPILNEWKRRFPADEPVALHEKYWQTRLICPGGGTYVWNEEWQTMESTVYGHPGNPKSGPPMPATLSVLDLAGAGLTFEENGLRARVELERRAAGAK